MSGSTSHGTWRWCRPRSARARDWWGRPRCCSRPTGTGGPNSPPWVRDCRHDNDVAQVRPDDVAAARDVLREIVALTPLLHSRVLSDRLGGPVFLKCENLQ